MSAQRSAPRNAQRRQAESDASETESYESGQSESERGLEHHASATKGSVKRGRGTKRAAAIKHDQHTTKPIANRPSRVVMYMRRRQYVAINEAIAKRKNEVAKSKNDCGVKRLRDPAFVCSQMRYEDISGIYGHKMKMFKPEMIPVPEERLTMINQQVQDLYDLYGTPMLVPERVLTNFIMAIITNVCCSVKDTDTITVGQQVPLASDEINIGSKADIVINRLRDDGVVNRICVTEAKKDDLDGGLVQDIIMLNIVEALNASSGIEYTYGIVSNFDSWIFVRKHFATGEIEISTDKINYETSLEADIARVASKIYYLLACLSIDTRVIKKKNW